jgi:hypothetical protein
MKEIKITKYQADDGTMFDEYNKCFDYERNLEILKNKKEELKAKINEFLKDEDFYVNFFKLHIYGVEINLLKKESDEMVLAEFDVNYHDWNKFLETLKKEYNVSNIYIPPYYWIK